MDPGTALQVQLDLYRRMMPEERLAIALRLHELACDLAREGIRNQHPDLTAWEVEEHLRRRLELAR